MTASQQPTPNARFVGKSFSIGVDELPWQGEGGPTTVTTGEGWSFSTCSPVFDRETDQVIPGVRVSSFTVSDNPNDPSTWARHPDLDGKIFATSEEARQAAYEAGVLRYFFYRKGW